MPASDSAAGPPADASAAQAGAVRKTVTVVFCDLGGSTSFGERTDPEVAREVMARYHALLQSSIDAHGGTVAKFMGDGMMATFGIPEIAEDDAVRAVRAGIDGQRVFTEFAANVSAQHGETLTLRVGVNTGEVVIASGDADLIGDALNVAARLEKACRPGHVLVGEETWRLTRGEFGYESLGEVTVAGRGEPVAIFEVTSGASTTVESASPFVGRDPEMQRLLAVYEGASSARAARLVTVLGSPGVGKTRLSRELCAVVEHDANAITFEVRCDRAGDATFAPIAQLIREAAGLGDDAEAEPAATRVGRLFAADEPDRDRLTQILAGLVGAAPARSVEETFWAIRRLVTAVATTRPTVVVIDDVQWAEPLLLDLLEHLAEWVQDVPVMLLCLARPELREVRPSLAERGRRVEDTLALDGLDSAATEQLAAGLLGTDRLPAGLVARLPTSTDGNPLFVRELVRMLVDDQVIRRRDGEWELTIDADAVEVPPTIQSLLATRVERLPDDERNVLELASVIGAEFNLGALRELAGTGTPVINLLEAMRRKELVEPTGTYWGDEPVHRFHHVLIRDSAYRRLLKTTRADLHERVAVWTDHAASGLIGEHEAVIAFHYEQAFQYRQELGSVDEHATGLGRRAAELLATAADRALGRDDLASAGALARRALVLLPASDADARAALLLIACECLLASGDVVAARPVVEQLTAAAGSDAALGAWAASFDAQLIGLTDPDGLVRAEAAVTAAASVMGELGDGAGEAKAHQVRAGLLARLGRVGDAELELEVALDAARSVDDRRRVTAVLGAAPVAALWGPSPVARAGGRCLDVVRLLRITTASPSVEATSMRCQAVLEALRGRFDVSRSMLASARATLEELGLRHGIFETQYLAGVVELIADDPAAAIEPLRTSYLGLSDLGVGVDAGRAAALLARALLAESRVDEAEPMAAASEALAGQDLKTAIAWRVAKAEVLAARGDAIAGVALAEKAVEIAAATDLIIDHADACVALAGLRDAAGDARGARAARADAVRLYEVKGATVPAERLVDQSTSARPAPAASAAPPAAVAPNPMRPPLGSRTDRAENASTRQTQRFVALVSEGRIDEAAALSADDVVLIDHRSTVSTAPLRGLDEFMANVRAIHDVGLTEWSVEPLAVRGDRLHLSRFSFGTPGGSEAVMLGISELNTDGRGFYNAFFDEDALQAAQDELDERYLAGEGAPHTRVLEIARAAAEAGTANDLDALGELLSPEFSVIDHQQLGMGSGDGAYLVAAARTSDQLAITRSFLNRTLHVAGDALLAVQDLREVTPEGNEYSRTQLIVLAIDASNHIGSMEWFDEHDFAAALARLDELGTTDSRHPRAENAVTRLQAHIVELARARRSDAGRELLAENFIRLDRRHGISAPTASGRDEFLASFEAWFEVGFDQFTIEPVAVRGDRLGLSRLGLRSTDGREIAMLGVYEIDDSGRFIRGVNFDEDNLADALTELDARYLAGEGAPHARVLRIAHAANAAGNGDDLEALGSLLSPDFAMVDHRRLGFLGFGAGDAEHLLESSRTVIDATTSQTPMTRTVHVAGDVLLAVLEARRVDDRGSEYSWPICIVVAVNSSDLISRMEWFDVEDFDAALTRLDELGTAPHEHRVENASVRVITQVNELTGPWDEFPHLFADNLVLDDRRPVVGMPASGGRDEVMATQRISSQFGLGQATSSAIAVRGDRLSLFRATTRTADDFEFAYLVVVEINKAEQVLAIVIFDDDAFTQAVDELDARFLSGEGAPDAEILDIGISFVRCANAMDWPGLRDLLADGFTFSDRRQLSWPTLDRDHFIEMQQSYGDAVQQRLTTRALQVRGRAVLSTIDSVGFDAESGEFEWSFHVVTTIGSDQRIERFETFAEDDLDAAVARLDELGAPTGLENDVTRSIRVLFDRGAAGEFDLADMVTDDIVRFDTRHAVSTPTLHGRAEFEKNLEAIYDVFDFGAIEPLAIRGGRVALMRVMLSHEGFTASMLGVYEADEQGLLCRGTSFDEDNLAGATAELEARYLAGEGAPYAEILEQLVFRFIGAYNARDWALLARAPLGSDTVFVDHRPASFGEMVGVDQLVEYFETMLELVPDLTVRVPEIPEVGSRGALFRMMGAGHTADGGEIEFEVLICSAVVEGAARSETFPGDELDAALARFQELGADPTA